jgi:hypothetical protein
MHYTVPTPKEDSECLMKELLPFAKQMLSQEGEFYPYGGVLRPSGDIVHISASIEGNDHPDSQSLIEILTRKLKDSAQSGEAKATGMVFDVRITCPGEVGKSDAIQISLNHSGGFSADVFFPYSIEEPGKVVFKATFAQKGIGAMFT